MIELILTITSIICFIFILKHLFCLESRTRFKYTCAIIGISYICIILAHITNNQFLTITNIIIFGCSALNGLLELISFQLTKHINPIFRRLLPKSSFCRGPRRFQDDDSSRDFPSSC